MAWVTAALVSSVACSDDDANPQTGSGSESAGPTDGTSDDGTITGSGAADPSMTSTTAQPPTTAPQATDTSTATTRSDTGSGSTGSSSSSSSSGFCEGVLDAPLPETLPDGQVDVEYSAQFELLGGTDPTFVWTLEGDLPAGLAFDPRTQVLSGTPTESAFAELTVTVAGDGTGACAIVPGFRDYVLAVAQP